MDVKRGGIYVLSKEWQPFEQPIVNHLPIIAIGYNKEEEYVYAVQIGMKSEKSKLKDLIFIEFYIDRKKRISCISCDAVYKIPIEYINHIIGSVNYEIVSEIRTRSHYFYENPHSAEKWDSQTDEHKLAIIKNEIISNVKIIYNIYKYKYEYKNTVNSNNINSTINSNNTISGSGNVIGNDNNTTVNGKLTEKDFDFENKELIKDFMTNENFLYDPYRKFKNIKKACKRILIITLTFLLLFVLYLVMMVVFDIDISEYIKLFFDALMGD